MWSWCLDFCLSTVANRFRWRWFVQEQQSLLVVNIEAEGAHQDTMSWCGHQKPWNQKAKWPSWSKVCLDQVEMHHSSLFVRRLCLREESHCTRLLHVTSLSPVVLLESPMVTVSVSSKSLNFAWRRYGRRAHNSVCSWSYDQILTFWRSLYRIPDVNSASFSQSYPWSVAEREQPLLFQDRRLLSMKIPLRCW